MHGLRVVLGAAYHLGEVERMVEWILLIGNEEECELVLLEDDFFDAELLGHAAHGDGFDEFLGGCGNGTETVDKAFAIAVELLVGSEVVKLFVKEKSFADAGDIVVRQQHLQIGLNDTLPHVFFIILHLLLE